MYEQCIPAFESMDVVVMCAAVADYAPAKPVANKMKKDDRQHDLELVPTRDILADMGARKRKGQFIAGFALETDQELEHARAKLRNKNLDLVVLNSLNDSGAGFGHDTNKVTLLDAPGETALDLMTKEDTARDIVAYIIRKTK
jgi:phosphopantothenoylcysteine decarboxylase/phosphopantothenate--cysteine ligase